MPRPPRLQFPGAIYHIVTRGDGRRAIFHDDGHYVRLTKGLADEVLRSSWEVIAYCWMPNHIHLNPCRGARPLAEKPGGWIPSSYPGYARRLARNDFVQYDALHEAWPGECGGKDPASAYRRYVAQGLSDVPENPLKSALREWVIGSEDFLKRMVALVASQDEKRWGSSNRRLGAVTVDEVIETVAEIHEAALEQYVGFRSLAPGREMAALLCRRYTSATHPFEAVIFGFARQREPRSDVRLIRDFPCSRRFVSVAGV